MDKPRIEGRHPSHHDGFLRVGAATPKIRVGDIEHNVEAIVSCVERACSAQVRVLALPELCLVGYTSADLLHDYALLSGCRRALNTIIERTAHMPVLFCVGLPVAEGGHIYNCAAVICAGALLGFSAKRNLPMYGEFYEGRWFTPAPNTPLTLTSYPGVPLGSKLVYRCIDPACDEVVVGVEICEDLWVAQPPSTAMTVNGDAVVILNPSASDEMVGKAAYRKDLVSATSARLMCSYVYADAGEGESSTDMVFAGHNLVAEHGRILAQTPLMSTDMAVSEIDIELLLAERRRVNTWQSCHDEQVMSIPFSFAQAASAEQILLPANELTRAISPSPFVPSGMQDRAERCEEILTLQAAGLRTRLAHTGTTRVVLGLSGGLDSTLALLVAQRAFDMLGLARTGIEAVSMPGFGTTTRTRSNAQALAEELGVSFREISIAAAVEQHFSDIGHDRSCTDVTYENSQARERTQVLMDLACRLGGFVVGTGDLSELALGWATYNGDHMSMYAVNAGVPKTLVRHLVAHVAKQYGGPVERILDDVLDTPVSPELLPPSGDGRISQKTEDLVGPYELHDFFLYYLVRRSFAPAKIYRLALHAFADRYQPAEVLSWLKVFYRRFFAQQFKRSCMPDGPKVGSVTLSPRGDWRMPSDASVRLWLDELDTLG